MHPTREKAQLMSASEVDRTLVRLAHEILERTHDLDRLVFIGIRRRGAPLAQRLSKKIETLERRVIPVGILDISLYRDDLSTVSHQPVLNSTWSEVMTQIASLRLLVPVLGSAVHSRVTGLLSTLISLAASRHSPFQPVVS